MQYVKSVPFKGDKARAFAAAEMALLPNSFAIVEKASGLIIFKGGVMTSNQQNPIKGATRIRIEAVGSELRLTAELGGVKFMAWFVCLFPILLGLGLCLAFWLTGAEVGPRGLRNPHWFIQWFAGKWWAAMLPVAPWLIIGPLMAAGMKRSTTKALDTLLNNMVAS